MRRIIRVFAFLGTILGFCLFGLNLAGLDHAPSRHPSTVEATAQKAGIPLKAADEVIHQLEGNLLIESEQDVNQLMKVFSSGVMHYWPEPGETDAEILYDWRENWFLALTGRLEILMFDVGLMSAPKISRLERFDYRDIIAKGVGFCSQVSLAVTDYLQGKGVPSYVWGLDGHVVSVVGPLSDALEYVIDADYGVYLPYSRAEIEQSPELIRNIYLDAGYDSQLADKLVGYYGSEGNGRYPMARWEDVFLWIKWIVPVLMIVVAFGILWLVHPQRKQG